MSYEIPLPLAGVGVTIILFTWVYTSLVQPSLTIYPGEPPLLPGAVPILGHALAFNKDSSKVHAFARQWSNDLNPVSLYLMGQRIYVVLSPRDFAATWRSKTLSFDPIIKWGLNSLFGMSNEAAQRCPPPGFHAFIRDTLAPGDGLNLLTKKFLEYLEIGSKELEKQVKSTPNGELEISSLFDWSRDFMATASTSASAGPQILVKNPGLLRGLWNWEESYFRFSFGLPRWMMRKDFQNRDNIIDAFIGHLHHPYAIPAVSGPEKLMKEAGFSDRDIAVGSFSIWSGLQANANLAAFWLLHYILFFPECRQRVLVESAPAFDSEGHLVDLDYLVQKTPFLLSMYYESLRWSSGVLSVRKVMEDTVIGGYTFKTGAMVMMPGRPGHFAPEIFGDDVDTFVPDRFVREESNPGIKAVKPFGGGSTLCPGRFFATNEVFSFVATMLRRFDIQVCDGETPANPNTSFPTVGLYAPDHDVKARVRLRN